MQLKLKRSQRKGMTGKIIYHLDVRADIPDEDLDLIRKYKLGKHQVYTSESLKALSSGADAALNAGQALGIHNPGGVTSTLKGVGLGIASRFAMKITVDDLTQGKSIECKDLLEMLDAEQGVINACENLKTYLQAAESFDGREVVHDI